jgi:hypothetical protein
MKKLIPIFLILLALPLVFVVVFMKMTEQPVVVDANIRAYRINKEYTAAVNGYLDKMEQSLGQIGEDFSLEDKTLLTDPTRLQQARKVVEETVRIDNQLDIDMKAKVDELKSKYVGAATPSPELQAAYDGLVKDFQDLQQLEKGRGDAMLVFLDFVIANQGKISVQGDKVVFTPEDLSAQYNALEQAALAKQDSFIDEQNGLLDLHDAHMAAFARELGKLQK